MFKYISFDAKFVGTKNDQMKVLSIIKFSIIKRLKIRNIES